MVFAAKVDGDVFSRSPTTSMNIQAHLKPLRILKFGGTSVADARCMENVVEIIRGFSQGSDVAIVVSAMSGVTNKLIQATAYSEIGDRHSVQAIFNQLRGEHKAVVSALFPSTIYASAVVREIDPLFEEGYRLCENAIGQGESTPERRDAISGLGERLSARLVAALLSYRGLSSQAIDATEVLVTNSSHGQAEPLMDSTRERCRYRLRPLLFEGIIPVVTGFIGATSAGVLTTLGRGGSDYSATILAAALDADEVIIWSDVDGVLTADPRVAPEASTIPELSYPEATELAYFGAKVLHPKTLGPLDRARIPVWIRNSFAPEQLGTKITSCGSRKTRAVKAVTTRKDVALIKFSRPDYISLDHIFRRILPETARIGADVLLIRESSSQSEIDVIVAPMAAKPLRDQFCQLLAEEKLDVFMDCDVALLTLVGENLHHRDDIAERAATILKRVGVDTLSGYEMFSEHSLSIVVRERDAKAAVLAIHREFQLGFEVASLPTPEEVTDQLPNR